MHFHVNLLSSPKPIKVVQPETGLPSKLELSEYMTFLVFNQHVKADEFNNKDTQSISWTI